MAKNKKQRWKVKRKGVTKQRRVVDDGQYQSEPVLRPAGSILPTDAVGGYMARLDASPPMKDTWRAEDEHRERHSHRPREPRDRIDRYNPAPSPRRGETDSLYRPREDPEIDSYRPLQDREHSRDSRKPHHRRYSPSPKHSSKPQPSHHARGRPLDDRVSRPRDPSSDRAAKRRRTQSPSPARSDRWAPVGRRGSPDRERPDPRDRRSTIDRAFSPRRTSPIPHSRTNSRDLPQDIDSYKPSHRRREPTPPPSRRRERRSQSPPQPSPSPRPHRSDPKKAKQERNLSPYSARVLKTEELATENSTPPANNAQTSTRSSATADPGDSESMEGGRSMKGNYNNRGNFHNRPHRPYVDTRHQHGGPPPPHGPNGAYYNSPQSASSPFNRGGWQGQPGPHGPMNNSPPYRQNSYPPQSGPHSQHPNAYYHNQQQGYPPHQQHNQPPHRGGYQNRGGYGNNQNQYDRRFSGPGPNNYQQHPRGRGNHHNNWQWNSGGRGRGGPQGQNFSSHPNSVQTSPAPSQHSSHDTREPSADTQEPGRPPREPKAQEDGPVGIQNQQGNTPSKDSKFSFAFKSKSQPNPAKPPPDLNTKTKQPFRPLDDRISVLQQKKDPPHQRNEREPPVHPDRRQFQDRRPPMHPNDRKHPYDRASSSQGHDRQERSPPPKRLKPEPRPRPKLPQEFVASESIYYRKPGNESVVGAGTYGKVFKAIHIFTRDKFALKKIRMEGERDGFPITAVREIKLLQHLRHAHVVALQEVMVEKNEAYMVFEYLSHDLTGLINHPTFKLTPAHKKDLARQMFEGLDFLHRRGVLHRDIKAANILISSSGQLKYADFGLARFYTKSRQLDYTNRVITIWYRPPELLLGETQYGPAVDIWSAACVFMEMFTRKAVFPGEGGELSQLEKVYNVLGTPTRAEWPRISDLPWFELMSPSVRKSRQFEAMFGSVLSTEALNLMQECFKYDPILRPNAEEVLKHAYFTSEEPAPKQATELEDVKGDWHEFESKQHRRGEEKKRKAEWEKEREKRKRLERDAKERGISVDELVKLKEARDGKADKPKDVPESSAAPENAPPPPPAMADGDGGEESDGDGSARMSVSPG